MQAEYSIPNHRATCNNLKAKEQFHNAIAGEFIRMEVRDSSPAREVILEVENVSKSFPGVKALDSVSFDLRKGEAHALVGENGFLF
jgi:ABC-type glutathione transport system ATPase component